MDHTQGTVAHASYVLDGVAQNWTQAVSYDDDDPAPLLLLQVMAKITGPNHPTDLFMLDLRGQVRRLVGRLYSMNMMYHDTPLSEWAVFLAVVVFLLLVDAVVLQRRNEWGEGYRNNLAILGFWVCTGLTYNLYLYLRFGATAATDWCTGYILEWMLSIDNIFVFHIIFRFYKMPPVLMRKALFFGIAGAVLFRMLTFFTLGSLLHLVHWFRKAIGVMLLYSAYQAVADDGNEDSDISQTWAVRTLRSLLGDRLVEKFDETGDQAPRGVMEGRLLVWDSSGRTCVTITAFVILILEVTDILFALDSVSAKIGQIHSLYVGYTSSILAIFGLRAMFFVVRDLAESFDMLKYGICVVLIFIGVEMMLDPWVHLKSSLVCFVITVVFFASIAVSVASQYSIRELAARLARARDAQDSAKQHGWKPTFAPEEVAGDLHSAPAAGSAGSEGTATRP